MSHISGYNIQDLAPLTYFMYWTVFYKIVKKKIKKKPCADLVENSQFLIFGKSTESISHIKDTITHNPKYF